MKTKAPSSVSLAKKLEEMARLEALVDPSIAPWQEVAKLLSDFDIEGAALKASQACGPGLGDNFLQKMILDQISNIAVMNDVKGPGIESMWASAAEFGYHIMAYNAANEIYQNAKSVDDYKLASRYYNIAFEKVKNPKILASAITNYAAIIRDGNITGKKDFLGAIELYEKAADMGLVNAMFNAGNVLLWLVEAGQSVYAERAEKWFLRVINVVESGTESLDLGGDVDRNGALIRAHLRLASMHLHDQLEHASQETFDQIIAKYPGDDYAQWLVKSSHQKRLTHATLVPGANAGENWASVLQINGWTVNSSTPFDFEESGVTLEIACDSDVDKTMIMMVFDYFNHPELDPESVAAYTALEHSRAMNCPVFYAGTKAYFVNLEDQMYSVLQVAYKGKFGVVPIWAGATACEVFDLLRVPLPSRFISGREDPNNCIPRLINALDEGITLDGTGLPNAIWIGADDVLCFPIHRADEPDRHGLTITHSIQDLEHAFEENLKNR